MGKITNKITIGICTIGRWDTSLPMLLQSILFQQELKKYVHKIHIYNDDKKCLRPPEFPYNPLEKNERLKKLIKEIPVPITITNSEQTDFGQVKGHQKLKELCETELLLRIDDDCIFTTELFIQKLVRRWKVMNSSIEHYKKLGALGFLILPTLNFPKLPDKNETTTNIIDLTDQESILKSLATNYQWSEHERENPILAEHLYSSFLYNTTLPVNYNTDLSPVGFREETMFTYDMSRAGYICAIDPTLIVWHLQISSGGTRSEEEDQKRHAFYQYDENLFLQWIAKYQKHQDQNENMHIIIMKNGLGDHYVFKRVLPDLLEKHKHSGKKIVVLSCYPMVFSEWKNKTKCNISIRNAIEEHRLEILDINHYHKIIQKNELEKLIEEQNVYGFMGYYQRYSGRFLRLEDGFRKLHCELDSNPHFINNIKKENN